MILNDSHLAALYGPRAEALVAAIKTRIVNDPYCRARFLPGFASVHHIVAHPVGVLLELYLLEGDQPYLEGESATTLATITAQAERLRATLFPQPGDPQAVAWGSTACVDLNSTYPDCYFVNLSDHPACTDSQGAPNCGVSDVSHANEFIFTAVELYRAGIVFTREDVNWLIYTFMNQVWNGDLAYPGWRDFVDGHNEPPGGKYGPWKMGRNIAPGWVALAGFDAELDQVLELAAAAPRRNLQTLHAIAFPGELARAKVAGDCQYSNRAREIPDGMDNDCDGLVDE